MNTDNTDLRIVKTRQAIRKTYIDLIKENGKEVITITKLTKRAKLNRGTFYLHYKNIEELSNEFYNEFMTDIYNLFKEGLNKEYKIEIEGEVVSVPLFQINILNYIKENRDLYINLWLIQKSEKYRSRLKKFVKDIVFYHKNSFFNKKDLCISEDYYLVYIISAYMGVIGLWIENDCQDSIEEIAWTLSTLNRKGVML